MNLPFKHTKTFDVKQYGLGWQLFTLLALPFLSTYFPRLVSCRLIFEYSVYGERSVYIIPKVSRVNMEMDAKFILAWIFGYLQHSGVKKAKRYSFFNVYIFEVCFLNTVRRCCWIIQLHWNLLSASPLPLSNVLMSNLRHQLQLEKSWRLRGGEWKMKSEVLFSE